MKTNKTLLLISRAALITAAWFCADMANETLLDARMIPARSGREAPGDTAGAIRYFGRELTRDDYDKRKKEELKIFHAQLKQEYRLDFKMRSTKYFNIAYRCPDEKMNVLQKYLISFFNQIYPRFFKHEPSGPFRVVYFEDRPIYEKLTGYSSYGFYSPQAATLTTYAFSGHGTLWHELIHAFMHANAAGDHQEWFSEGLASFYEMAFLNDGKVDEGYANWRMPQLQEAIRNKSFVPLKHFMMEKNMNVDFGYAEARFIFCYLWINGRMDEFVKAYLFDLAPNYSGQKLGTMAIKKIEELTGKDINTINNEYISLATIVRKNQKLHPKK